ncbi:LysR family transcriptional regulator [Limibaculum sp. FT325]|uniref:LysR family transcriptional regulator n=1 Tax=Thermohalobaculum sediminis TaxID=2939436 RepID=UPI0020BF0E0F|nr:LysR family transcriptional regulator [Limibaculum sediminis]MCL5776269.1 LysR family transcriptional regulator [Limibaculum sediminis]
MSQRHDPGERLARDLDWNLLRTFVAVAEERSITRGAERLRLKQPTVSNALRRLEDRLGRRLVDRGPGRFRLTEAGEVLYREAVDIHGAIHRLGIALRDVGEEISGHVRIMMASHVVCPLFDEALAGFHKAHPRATLSIEVSASRLAIEAVAARRASFAVCLVAEKNPRLSYRRLFREYFGLFCGPPHPLFGREGLAMADLEGQSSVSFVTDSISDALRNVAILRASARLDDRVVATSSHLEEVRRMIVAGLGVGPLPIHVAARDVAAGLLWRLPPYDDPPEIDVHVVWHPRARRNRAEEALLARILAQIDAVPIEARTYRDALAPGG